jgi:hypothetical protein
MLNYPQLWKKTVEKIEKQACTQFHDLYTGKTKNRRKKNLEGTKKKISCFFSL